MRIKTHGFTLIELLIVTAIVAILAGIAYPSYRDFVRRSARSEAKGALLEDAQFLERVFTTSNSYAKDSAGNDITSKLPVQQTPRDGGSAKYTIALDADGSSASAFKLVATPTGSMSDDPCGNLTLDNLGNKDRSGTGPSINDCWGR